jgi:hypothetical protein
LTRKASARTPELGRERALDELGGRVEMLTDVPETPKTIIPKSDEPPRGGSVSTVPTRAPDTVGRAVVVILATRETTRGASRGLMRRGHQTAFS